LDDVRLTRFFSFLSISGKSDLLNSIKCIILKQTNFKIKLNEENCDSVSHGNSRKCLTSTTFPARLRLTLEKSILLPVVQLWQDMQ